MYYVTHIVICWNALSNCQKSRISSSDIFNTFYVQVLLVMSQGLRRKLGKSHKCTNFEMILNFLLAEASTLPWLTEQKKKQHHYCTVVQIHILWGSSRNPHSPSSWCFLEIIFPQEREYYLPSATTKHQASTLNPENVVLPRVCEDVLWVGH